MSTSDLSKLSAEELKEQVEKSMLQPIPGGGWETPTVTSIEIQDSYKALDELTERAKQVEEESHVTDYYAQDSEKPAFRLIEIPQRYMPKGTEGGSFDPDSLRSAAKAHIQSKFDHVMHVKAWVVLWLLDNCSEIIPDVDKEK